MLKNQFESKGHIVEDILSRIISEPLLLDFVHLRPLCLRGRKTRELSDLLIENAPIAIPIQLKVQGIDERNIEKSQAWAIKHLRLASRQIEGALRWISQQDIEVDNSFRGKVKFPARTLTGIHGVVIVDYFNSPFSIGNDLPRRFNNLIPIHYLTYSDFHILCKSLMTLPDLIDYLNERAKIPAWATPKLSAERDTYAYYHMHGGKFHNVAHWSDFTGEWRRLTTDYAIEYKEKLDADHNAGFFSEILQRLHEIDPKATDYEKGRIQLMTRVHITDCMRRLNSLKRLHRRLILKKLHEKALRADTSNNGVNYFLFESEDRKTIFIFLASRLDREERFEKLVRVC